MITLANLELFAMMSFTKYIKDSMPDETDGGKPISVLIANPFEEVAKPAITIFLTSANSAPRSEIGICGSGYYDDSTDEDIINEYYSKPFEYRVSLKIHANSTHEMLTLSGLLRQCLYDVIEAPITIKDYTDIDNPVSSIMSIVIDDENEVQTVMLYGQKEKDYSTNFTTTLQVEYIEKRMIDVINDISITVDNADHSSV